MKRNALWTVAAAAGLGLIGCSSNHTPPSSTSTRTNPAPTDFASFVNQQLQLSTQPSLVISDPAPTSSLTTDLALGSATAFGSVGFGKGDMLPTGTNQASVACSQAGTSACNPGVSDDLNSNLN